MAEIQRGPLAHLYAEAGLTLQRGIIPTEFPARLEDLFPKVTTVHRSLSNQILRRSRPLVREGAVDFGPSAARFLIDQGIGATAILRIKPEYAEREDGKTVDFFVVVDQDTDLRQRELRLHLLADADYSTTPQYDPHRIDSGLESDNVNLRLGAAATLERGLHDGSPRAQVTQAGHVLSAAGAQLRDTAVGQEIATLDQRQQAHFTDLKQKRGAQGSMITSLAGNKGQKNVLEGPFTRLGLISPDRFPEDFYDSDGYFFQLVVPEYLLAKSVPAEVRDEDKKRELTNAWFGDIDMSYLNKGRIRLVKAVNPDTIIETQEVAFAAVLRDKNALTGFTEGFKRSADQGGW